jgi:hypothetical protein
VKTTKLKLMSAIAGAGAVLAMGVLSVAFSESSSADPLPPGPVTTSEVTTGETSTETTAPETPTTTLATPSRTGPAPLPSELEGVPG